MKHTKSARRLAAVAATTAALGATLLAPPASAVEWDVVASGLDNPRQLSFTKNTLYVAEAGRGGGGPCVEGAEGDACLGLTGAVTRVKNGEQKQVLDRLPSLAAEDGSGAIGPADVFVVGSTGRYAVTVGLGNDPAVKEDLGRRGRRLGTVVRGKFPHTGPRISADIAAYELANDPDGLGPDSNPTGLIRRSRGAFVLTDSGGNTLLRSRFGDVTRLATFGSPGDAPPPLGFPIQPVPTSVAVGPDGAFYVSELTGFPFVPGLARIHRVVPGMPSTVYATGLTNVTDLAWYDGDLYAVQIADNGLQEEPIGSLVRVNPAGIYHTTVADGLFAPYGLAFHYNDAYVTTCSVCPGTGEVIRIPVGS